MASDSSTNPQGATAGPATSETGSSAPTAPPIINELVAKFTEHRDTCKADRYGETALRRDFLDPFFAAMGWDIEWIKYAKCELDTRTGATKFYLRVSLISDANDNSLILANIECESLQL